MSWQVTGYVDNGELGDVTWQPSYEDLNPSAQAQADFAIKTIEDAFTAGVLEGAYNVTFAGHVPTDDSPEDRFSFSMSFAPSNSRETPAVETAENTEGPPE